jgi:hypothetical protein
MTKSEAQEMKKALREYTREVTRTPEAALKALQDMGIVTKAGDLSENYGGQSKPPKRTKAKAA